MGRRTIAQITWGVVIAALLVAGQSAAANAAGVTERECEPGLPDRAVCGTLTVSEGRSNPESRFLDLPYVVIPAETQPASGTPVVTLAGGPGETTTATAEALAADPRIGGSRDVVVLAQRGSTESSAPFSCPAATSAYIDTFTTDDPPSTEMSEVGLAMQACLTAFAEAGGDTSAYTRADFSADLVDLRATLGYPTWTLYGESWSTKIMQLTAQRDNAGVDAIVLDGFSPLDRDLKGDAYFALADTLNAISARSNGEYPDLNGDLTAAAEVFSDDPAHGLLTNPVTGKQRYYSLTGSDVVTIVQQALYDPATASAVPYLLSRLADGEKDAINPFIPAALDQLTSGDLSLFWLNACRDEQPYWSADPTVAPEEGSDSTDPVPLPVLSNFTAADQLCGAIGLPPSSGELRAPTPVSQPTLIFRSDSDPLYAGPGAEAGRAVFADNQMVVVEANGRAGAASDACALDVLAGWLASPGSPVSTTNCADAAEAFPVLPADAVHPTSRFSSVVTAVDQRNWFELTIPLIFGVFAALWFVGWVIGVLVQAIRREPFGLMLASGIAPVTGLAFLGTLWLTVSAGQAAYPGFTLVGVPTIVPWLGLALLGVGFFGLIPVWRLGGRGSAALAASATLVWLAAIVWFVWVAVLPS
ncbi:alpha/beta fold hydrolase [Herbiconiux sp. A18JL235]|uniref:Alpha/beta fold hydrolase n=1 Tax=Herbiconiux sp. A18JL235 TaxID=3152363 RepID=A0AB39BM62_9MICO